MRRLLAGVGALVLGAAGAFVGTVVGAIVATLTGGMEVWTSAFAAAAALAWAESGWYMLRGRYAWVAPPGPALGVRLLRRAVDPVAFFLSRSGIFTLLFLTSGGLVALAVHAIGTSLAWTRDFLNFAPPHVSGNAIAAVAGVLVALVTIFGGRSLESKRGLRDVQRGLQRDLYPRLLEFFARAGEDWRGDDARARWDALRREAVLVASPSVLAISAHFAGALKEQGLLGADGEAQADADPEEREEALHALMAAMRADLGLRTPENATPWMWRALDPRDRRRKPETPPATTLSGRVRASFSE